MGCHDLHVIDADVALEEPLLIDPCADAVGAEQRSRARADADVLDGDPRPDGVHAAMAEEDLLAGDILQYGLGHRAEPAASDVRADEAPDVEDHQRGCEEHGWDDRPEHGYPPHQPRAGSVCFGGEAKTAPWERGRPVRPGAPGDSPGPRDPGEPARKITFRRNLLFRTGVRTVVPAIRARRPGPQGGRDVRAPREAGLRLHPSRPGSAQDLPAQETRPRRTRGSAGRILSSAAPSGSGFACVFGLDTGGAFSSGAPGSRPRLAAVCRTSFSFTSVAQDRTLQTGSCRTAC